MAKKGRNRKTKNKTRRAPGNRRVERATFPDDLCRLPRVPLLLPDIESHQLCQKYGLATIPYSDSTGRHGYMTFSPDGRETGYLVPDRPVWSREDLEVMDAYMSDRAAAGCPLLADYDSHRSCFESALRSAPKGEAQVMGVDFEYDPPLADGSRTVLVHGNCELQAVLVIDAGHRLLDGAWVPGVRDLSADDAQAELWAFAEFAMRREVAGCPRALVAPWNGSGVGFDMSSSELLGR